jgi:hypothetical protein
MKQTLGIILLLVLHVALGQYVKALPYDQITITKAFIKDTATIAIVLVKAESFLLIKISKLEFIFKSH